jgi:hypothetical protein
MQNLTNSSSNIIVIRQTGKNSCFKQIKGADLDPPRAGFNTRSFEQHKNAAYQL